MNYLSYSLLLKKKFRKILEHAQFDIFEMSIKTDNNTMHCLVGNGFYQCIEQENRVRVTYCPRSVTLIINAICRQEDLALMRR